MGEMSPPFAKLTDFGIARRCAKLERKVTDLQNERDALRRKVGDEKDFSARRAELAAVLQAVRTEMADRIVAKANEWPRTDDQAAKILDSFLDIARTIR